MIWEQFPKKGLSFLDCFTWKQKETTAKFVAVWGCIEAPNANFSMLYVHSDNVITWFTVGVHQDHHLSVAFKKANTEQS